MAFDGALAVLLAAKYCRTFPLFQWREEALPAIGQRRDKFSFRVDLANLLQDRCGEMLMTLFPASLSFIDFQKDHDALYYLKALLVTLKHPYILPVVEIYYSKEKRALLVVQPFMQQGSLRDRIHSRACPTRSFEEKYQRDRAVPLPVEEIARFARQILEALRALRSKGIACDHLSTGNIVIDDQENARIAEIYTPLLAIDRHRHIRELTVPLEAANIDIDILLFGHVLYEMAAGATLTASAPDDAVLDQLPPEIADVLDWIFYPDSASKKDDIDGNSTFGEGSITTSNDDDDAESVSTRTSTSRKGGVIFRTDLDELLGFPLFADADVPPIDSLFSGFRLDSSMKTTVRRSMRVNASRNHAYVVQYKDAMALVRAKQRAERRVYDEKEKNDKRAQHQLLVSRGVADESATTGEPARRKSYRAHRFKAPLMRQASSASSSTTA